MQGATESGWLQSRVRKGWFEFRANGLRLQRGLRNLAARDLADAGAGQIRNTGDGTAGWRPIAESRSALWTSLADDRTAMVAGKVQNLRVAASRLDGLRLRPGQVFSFWKAVGRPLGRRGFVLGRELREGCMIASVGGGLCQLSNALYDAALAAGMDILERHAHSQTVPGSLAERGRDATVFWNYLDLRFRGDRACLIRVGLTADELVVAILGEPAAASRTRATSLPLTLMGQTSPEPDDCGECAQAACVERYEPPPRSSGTCYLLDEVWPEFDRWIAEQAHAGDVALMPLDGVRRKRAAYAWPSVHGEGVRRIEHPWLTLRRSLASRRLQAQGAERQRALMSYEERFARAYARSVRYDAERVVVPIGMLADLWRTGVLGGRHYEVMMARSPIAMLQQSLDRAAALHPESTTLGDFRADDEQVALEELALRQAAALVTPHRAVADFAGERYGVPIVRLDWVRPQPAAATVRGDAVLFPASALGRKGAYEVRDACRQLDLTVNVLGNASERTAFWEGVRTMRADPARLFDGVGCVVLPAFVEQRPRLLWKAHASGVPVICSPECGIPAQPGIAVVPAGDVPRLVEALGAQLSRTQP